MKLEIDKGLHYTLFVGYSTVRTGSCPGVKRDGVADVTALGAAVNVAFVTVD